MSRKCIVSKRSALTGNKRSHALNATKRKWNLNLQKAIIKVNGVDKKVKISTRALKTLKKTMK